MISAATSPEALPKQPSTLQTRQNIKAIVASGTGNLVAWYDFYIYAFAALYFSSQFFPSDDQTTQLLKSAAVFGVGFIMRPVGSWFFGRIADRKGRKTGLLMSVILMCFSALMIAVMPTYKTLEGWGVSGVFAAVLLMIARMLQGFSAGGEYGSTATYMSEVATSRNKGFLASLQYVTLIGGQLMTTLELFILGHFLDKDQMATWGWRVPFFIGALTAVVALYLRSHLPETAPKKELQNKDAGKISALAKYKKSVSMVVVTYPVMMFRSTVESPVAATLVILIPMLGLSFYTSISGIVKAELFPAHIRALGVGFPYAFANAIFGGSAESLALLATKHGIPSAFYFYVIAISVTVVIVSYMLPDARKKRCHRCYRRFEHAPSSPETQPITSCESVEHTPRCKCKVAWHTQHITSTPTRIAPASVSAQSSAIF